LVFLGVPLFVLLTVVFHEDITCNLLGMSYTGSPYAPQALLMDSVLLMHGVAAYGLLWGKRWGPSVAIATCGIDLATSLYPLVESGFSVVGPEPIVPGLVIVPLIGLRKRWAKPAPPQPPSGG